MRPEATIPDNLYSKAKRIAASGGFGSMDEYLADLITHDLQSIAITDDEFFTSEVVDDIRVAAAEVRTGNSITLDEFRAQAKLRNAEWQGRRAS